MFFPTPTRAGKAVLIPLLALFMVMGAPVPNPVDLAEKLWAQTVESAKKVISRLIVIDLTGEIVTTSAYPYKGEANITIQVELLRWQEMATRRGDSTGWVSFISDSVCEFGVQVDMKNKQLRALTLYDPDPKSFPLPDHANVPIAIDKVHFFTPKEYSRGVMAFKITPERQGLCFNGMP